jgi:hypothetical protein
MNRAFQMGGFLLLAVATGFAARRQAEPKNPPAASKPAQPSGGVPKAPAAKGAQRLVNPGNVATRLFRMTPEERDRALEQLPPQQQENARNTLAWFDGLPKEQQAIQLRRLEHFAELPPARKAEVRQMVTAANQLPPDRKRAVGQALLRLQQLNDQEREAILRRPAFQNRFSLEELKIIIALADAWMGPL